MAITRALTLVLATLLPGCATQVLRNALFPLRKTCTIEPTRVEVGQEGPGKMVVVATYPDGHTLWTRWAPFRPGLEKWLYGAPPPAGSPLPVRPVDELSEGQPGELVLWEHHLVLGHPGACSLEVARLEPGVSVPRAALFVAAVPFTVAFDVVTAPFQFIGMLFVLPHIAIGD